MTTSPNSASAPKPSVRAARGRRAAAAQPDRDGPDGHRPARPRRATSPTRRSPTTAGAPQGGVGMITVEASLVSPEPTASARSRGCTTPSSCPGCAALADAIKDARRRRSASSSCTPGARRCSASRSRRRRSRSSPRTPVPARADARRDPRADRATTRASARPRAARPASTSSRSTARTATCPPSSSRRSSTSARTSTAAASRTAPASCSRSSRAIRAACGEDYPLFCRISGEEGADGGFGIDETDRRSPRWLAGGRRRLHQRLGRQLVRAAPDDRADVDRARRLVPAAARDPSRQPDDPGDRGRAARRSRARRARARRRPRRPDRASAAR